ncbi:MAG: tetratricopeptide repeat protein [Thermoanaerobaculia bacterium]
MTLLMLLQARPVEWTLPVAMLLGGLVIGTIVAFVVSRRGAKTKVEEAASDAMPLELEIRDLDAKRDSLFHQLRELDDTSAKRDAAQLALERYELELEAARTLRRLDELTGRHAPGKRKISAKAGVKDAVVIEEPSAPASPWKGFLWGIGSAAAIAALVIFVAKSADERGDGGSMTGNIPGGGGMQSGEGAPDAELQQLLSRVQANPNDLDLRNELAFQQLMREQLMGVFETTQYVLERRPGDPAAMTYQSVVRLAMGQTAEAEQMLKQAIEARPDLLDARVYLSLTYAQMGRYDDAKAAIDEAIKLSPAEADRLRQLWTQVEAQKGQAPVQSAAGTKDDPHAGIALPPMAGGGTQPASTPAARPSADPRAVRGTLTLAAGGNVPRGAAVFLIVRPAGSKGGAPVAVARVDASSFPLEFEVSQANSMMGQPLPESMLIEARVDLDGNPMTRDAGAPSGAADAVAAGTSGVKIDLSVR